MRKLSDLLQEAGVSKVKLAKYLGVSRQMVYNYLELNSIENWPSEKRILICKLLGISEEKPDEGLEKLKVTAELMEDIETRLDAANRNSNNADIWDGTTASGFEWGEGTQNFPYLISSGAYKTTLY